MNDLINTLGILSLPAAALAAILGLINGLRALLRAGQTTGNQKALFRLLALHLWEPPLTLFWMTLFWLMLAQGSGTSNETISSPTVISLLATAPMAVLLAPIVSLRWPASRYRNWAIGTLILGALRWAGSWGMLYGLNMINVAHDDLGLAGVVAILGTVLLWFCVLRVHWILRKQQQMTAPNIIAYTEQAV